VPGISRPGNMEETSKPAPVTIRGGPQLPGKEVMQIPDKEDRLCLGMEAWDREGPQDPGEGAVRVPMGRRDRQISTWGSSSLSCR